MATPVILDCDPGHDDAIALLLALASPELELLGVMTTYGNSLAGTARTGPQLTSDAFFDLLVERIGSLG